MVRAGNGSDEDKTDASEDERESEGKTGVPDPAATAAAGLVLEGHGAGNLAITAAGTPLPPSPPGPVVNSPPREGADGEVEGSFFGGASVPSSLAGSEGSAASKSVPSSKSC